MNDSLRVREYENDKKEDVAARISEGKGIVPKDGNNRRIAFRDMWANAFIHKKNAFSAAEKDKSIKLKMPAPFVYLRVVFLYVIAVILLLSSFYFFDFFEAYPILCLLFATLVPFGCLLFFYELDTSKRIGVGVTLFNFFIGCGCALLIRFVALQFLYDKDGSTLSFLAACILSCAECVMMFGLIVVLVRSLRVKDVITGCFLGAIIGSAFAVMNNVTLFFNESFVSSKIYVSSVPAIYKDSSLSETIYRLFPQILWECIARSFVLVLTGVVFSGLTVYCRVGAVANGTKILYAILVFVGAFVLTCSWRVTSLFSSDLLIYLLRILHIVCACIISVRLVRSGLSMNKYE